MLAPPPPPPSCRPGTPQCFLLTPKLLPDLPFSPDVAVLQIMNGGHIKEASAGGAISRGGCGWLVCQRDAPLAAVSSPWGQQRGAHAAHQAALRQLAAGAHAFCCPPPSDPSQPCR